MGTFQAYVDRDVFDWQMALFGLNSVEGLFDNPVTLSDGTTAVIVIEFSNFYGSYTLTLSAAASFTVTGGHITAGTLSSIELVRDVGPATTQTVFTLGGLSVDASALDALLTDGAKGGTDPAFLAVFADAAMEYQAPLNGASTVFGSSLADEFFLSSAGGSSFNYVWTGGGEDTIHGSDGEDMADYVAASGALTIDFVGGTVFQGATSLGIFDDDVEDIGGSIFGDTFNGSGQQDVMIGNGGDDTFNGGNGDDWFHGGQGNDELHGDDGFDVATYSREITTDRWQPIYGIIVNLSSLTLITGASLASLADAEGQAAFDDIRAGRSMSVDAGEVVDTFNTVDTLDGIEQIVGSYYADFMVGSDADYGDILAGYDGDDWIYAAGGNDYLRGDIGDDHLDGGDGWDVVGYEWGDGVAGVTAIWGVGDSGEVTDRTGDTDTFVNVEELRGSDQRDLFVGNDGDNWVQGMGGVDLFTGGAGIDAFDYRAEGSHYRAVFGEDATHGINVDLETAKQADGTILGRGTDLWGNTDFYEDVENIDGSGLNDIIRGSSVRNILWGDDGNDALYGEAGTDDLLGEWGNDTLDGGAGGDKLDGGDGSHDVASYASAGKGVTVKLAGGSGNTNDAKGDTYFGIEDLWGSKFADKITGDGGDNIIRGGAGKDTLDGGGGLHDGLDYFDKTSAISVTLKTSTAVSVKVGSSTEDSVKNFEDVYGGSGKDKITGDSRANWLYGNAGDDSLSGAGGNDLLSGHAGNDTLSGGSGSDLFLLGGTPAGNNVDTIKDFAAEDVIGLDWFTFAEFIGDTVEDEEFASGAGFTSAQDVTDRLIYNTTDGRLYFDEDGVGGAAAIQIAILTGRPALSAGDFLVW